MSVSQTLSAPASVPASAAAVTVTVVVAVAEPHELLTVYEMVAVPSELPVTCPVDDIDAMAGLAEDHVPPVTDAVNVEVKPKQTRVVPLIVPATGSGLTVTG